MKLRIKGNSLRLRVTRLEVARLLSDGYVEEAVQLTAAPEAKLFYALRRDSSAARPAVQYAQNKVTVLLPAELARVWGTTDQVGIAEEIDLGEVGLLALLVEKDFGVWSEETKIMETRLTIRMPVRIAGLL